MRFANRRAALGVLSMAIAGGILYLMANYFFHGGDEGYGIIRSRLWWEIVLNAEIFSAALMWFTHVERVASREGLAKLPALLDMIAGIGAALVPVWIALIGAFRGWFKERVEVDEIFTMMVVFFILWLATTLMPWALNCVRRHSLLKPRWLSRGPLVAALYIAPICTLVVVGIWEWPETAIQTLTWAGPLIYLQGAMPYVWKALYDKRPQESLEPF